MWDNIATQHHRRPPLSAEVRSLPGSQPASHATRLYQLQHAPLLVRQRGAVGAAGTAGRGRALLQGGRAGGGGGGRRRMCKACAGGCGACRALCTTAAALLRRLERPGRQARKVKLAA